MSAAEASSFKFWEFVANAGIIVLIIGIVIEGIELWLPESSDQKVKAGRRRLARFGWLLVVFGLGAEFLGENRAKRIADCENLRLAREIEVSHKENLDLKIAVQRYIDGRHLNSNFGIAVALGGFKKVSFAVITSKDADSIDLGNAIEHELTTGAQWWATQARVDINRPLRLYSDGGTEPQYLDEGITLETNPLKSNAGDAAEMLVKVFEQSDIKAKHKLPKKRTEMTSDFIRILVGRNPNPIKEYKP